MVDDIWTPAAAGILAGLGVAMPMGAIAALLLREGLVNGFRVGASAAAGVATVDVCYCTVATLTGATFSRAIEDHRGAFLLASGVLIVTIGIRQLCQEFEQRNPLAPEVVRAPATKAFARFVGLTAINPITLVYFVALSGAVSVSSASWVGAAVFVVAVGGSSLAWQLLLAGLGSLFGTSVSLRTTRAVGVVASLLVVTLGAVVLVNGLAALQG
ncbi:LysE family transporter [Rhodococcus sovatensis]|uniref:LysE family transporter n=1 Tax=Rhodococcus sovatensis TaxID=1805840 RepID=A0ABZ2PCV8_9NOCA